MMYPDICILPYLSDLNCGDNVLNSELLYSNRAVILKQYCSTREFSGEVWAQKYGGLIP